MRHGFVTPVFSVKPSLSRCHASFHLYVRARAHIPFQHLSCIKNDTSFARRAVAWQFVSVALDLSTIDSRPIRCPQPKTLNPQPLKAAQPQLKFRTPHNSTWLNPNLSYLDLSRPISSYLDQKIKFFHRRPITRKSSGFHFCFRRDLAVHLKTRFRVLT